MLDVMVVLFCVEFFGFILLFCFVSLGFVEVMVFGFFEVFWLFFYEERLRLIWFENMVDGGVGREE